MNLIISRDLLDIVPARTLRSFPAYVAAFEALVAPETHKMPTFLDSVSSDLTPVIDLAKIIADSGYKVGQNSSFDFYYYKPI
jgi:hypothetical protein